MFVLVRSSIVSQKLVRKFLIFMTFVILLHLGISGSGSWRDLEEKKNLVVISLQEVLSIFTSFDPPPLDNLYISCVDIDTVTQFTKNAYQHLYTSAVGRFDESFFTPTLKPVIYIWTLLKHLHSS